MTEQMLIDAYCKIRSIDNTIPDDVLNFMKESAIERLKHINKFPLKETKLFRKDQIVMYHGYKYAVQGDGGKKYLLLMNADDRCDRGMFEWVDRKELKIIA